MSSAKAFQPIHPFPARMDPVAAMDGLVADRGRRLTVLDPMMGSGSIPVLASLRGHSGYGFDLDPLALMLARALANPLDGRFLAVARRVQVEARETEGIASVAMDARTQDFVDYWFDEVVQARLAALACAIGHQDDDLRPALWCALSRLIITKEASASRARDVSHSRPHVVRERAAIDPIERFADSAGIVAARHAAARARSRAGGNVHLDAADAKDLPLADRAVDRVATSPPYLQAIDYLRGHRMTLVWMGHSIQALRELRASVIGAARMLTHAPDVDDVIIKVRLDGLSERGEGILRRYVSDLDGVMSEIARVLKRKGQARFVVSSATLEGQRVSIERIVGLLAKRHGLTPIGRNVRSLPSDRRYLPPPGKAQGALDRRIRAEQLLTFSAP